MINYLHSHFIAGFGIWTKKKPSPIKYCCKLLPMMNHVFIHSSNNILRITCQALY